MRAVRQETFGGPEVLRVVEVDRPEPKSGEVLVRVRAAGVNPVDVAVRAGMYPLLGEPPFGVGWDISGVVEEAGAGARFAVGDEVFGMPFFPRAANGYSEYVAVPSRQVARKPTTVDHVQAAAIPLAALTAWQGLSTRRGRRGAAGAGPPCRRGCRHFAVQIAKAHGAHVIAMASAPKHDFVRGLGADEVIDYRTTDFTEAAREVDVVFDSSSEGERSLSVLRPGGTLVSIMEHGDRELAARVEASGRRFAGVSVEPDYASLEAITRLVDTGAVRPHVAETFPLAEAAKAHELVGSGRVQGKVVLSVD
ncbi:NADPH:quinone reductase [Streptomyces alboflavus]|uniref:NADPH:quinone reductase n=1 Tax=Streptomyces alboflavus TaxID=67267 RepID=A0A1Z1WSH5_9ACTN|nr:NADPH:quinone reductase [Streptomyces alboflavus]